ncbi:MAG: deoxyribodipyrimidine photo-lyase, partial [Alphaproteobacteria bacterium]
VPLFLLDDETPGRWRPGGASRWWLHRSLAALDAALERCGLRLLLRRGPAAEAIPALARECGAAAVHWNRQYEPWAVARDRALKPALRAIGVAAESFNAEMLHEPWTVATGAGRPFQVFTPYWRAVQAMPDPPAPLPVPTDMQTGSHGLPGERLADWALTPTAPDWAAGFTAAWQPGEGGARAALAAFIDGAAAEYRDGRDRPDRTGTSRLSPHLHFGEIGPRQIRRALAMAAAAGQLPEAEAQGFLREIAWRDFNRSLLFHNPQMAERNLKPEFDRFPWREDRAALRAWQTGRTGYPIVDAGLRELWQTGWMHNRVRMIAASFLVKHLLLPWQAGADWFWDTLVDADLANNAANWQWVAGSGADAAPYFRIFNPVIQGERFDPDGAYVRRWVPDLAQVPAKAVHRPWTLPGGVRGYPEPMVDHAAARARALAAYAETRGG